MTADDSTTDDPDPTTDTRILVPVRVLEGETIAPALAAFLAPAEVVLLGYHEFPEQTTPEQARQQFEDRAQDKLSEVATVFDEAGVDYETLLAFTNEREQTFRRVSEEEGCGAYVIPNPADVIEEVLVPLRGDVNVQRIGAIAGPLLATGDIDVTLLHVAESEEDAALARELLDEAAARLTEEGVPTERLHEETAVADVPIQFVADEAVDYDAVVMGEAAPSLRSLVFGEAEIRVAQESLGPVVVVRRVEEAESA